MRRPSRAVTVLAALALAGALLAVAAPVWTSATLTDPLTGRPLPVSATGTEAAPVVPALALVAAAAAVAVSTARRALLRACGVVLAVAGLGALVAAAAVVLDPGAPLAAAAQQAAGTTTAPLDAVSRAAWSVVALVPAAALVACGLWAAVAGPRWSSTDRFERTAAARVDPAGGRGPDGGVGAPGVGGRAPSGPARVGGAPRATPGGAGRRPGRSDEEPGTAAPALWDSLSSGGDPTRAPAGPSAAGDPRGGPDGGGARSGA